MLEAHLGGTVRGTEKLGGSWVRGKVKGRGSAARLPGLCCLWTPLHLCFLMVAITSRRTEAAPAWTPRARVSGCLARRCPALLGMADAGAGSVLRLQESIWPQGCGSSFSLRLCSFPLLHPPLATHTCISTSGPRFENCSC